MKNQKSRKKAFVFLALLSIIALSAFTLISPDSVGGFAGASMASLLLPAFIVNLSNDGGEAGGEEKDAEKKLMDKIRSEVSAKFDTLVKENSTLKGISDFEKKLSKAVTPEELNEIKSEVEAIGLKLKSIEELPKHANGGKGLKDALTDAFNARKAEIDEIVTKGQSASFKLELKAVGTMSVASTIGSGTTQVTITQDTGIISQIRKRELTYLAQVSVGTISNNRALWIEETDEEGTPVMIGEGSAKTQLEVQYVEKTMSVKKIAVYGKVTTELMADIPQLISYIQNNLMRRMDIVLEDQLFSGTGTGNNLKGLTEFATIFSAGALANTITDANEFDVIEAVALQVKIAFGMPNAIFVHPSTVAKMKLIKDTLGRPVWKDYVTIEGNLVVSGMRIVESTAVQVDNFVGGDLSVVHVLNRDEMGITIGLDGNDFTNNVKTMLLEKRLVQFVSANDTGLIVKGDFSDAISALDIVS
jgi:HK97 family phage major capsid protein